MAASTASEPLLQKKDQLDCDDRGFRRRVA
jgi:hypothetical protein